MRLIADIGGTNARLALSENGHVFKDSTRSYVNANWDSFYDVTKDFLSESAAPNIAEVVIALAGPVHATYAELTNHNWRVDTADLATLTGADDVQLLNDLTALGYAVPNLQEDQLKLVRQGTPKQAAMSQSLVVGIGTGFNVSPVLHNKQQVTCSAVEAGHIAMPHNITSALIQLDVPPSMFPTIESLFSGNGLTTFAQKLTGQPDLSGPATIAAYGDPKITQVVDQYAALLGRLLQDLSLAYMPSAGIYLAGSVARSVLSVASTACLQAFEHNPSPLLHPSTPVWSINDDLAALTGCAKIAI